MVKLVRHSTRISYWSAGDLERNHPQPGMGVAHNSTAALFLIGFAVTGAAQGPIRDRGMHSVEFSLRRLALQ